MKHFWLLSPLLFMGVFSNCSLQTLAIRSTGSILDYCMEAINEESDLQIAEQSIASDLKLLEGLIKGDPENDHLLLLASQGYCSYALGFAEDQDKERARMFYGRCRDFGLRILHKNTKFAEAFEKDLSEFKTALPTFSKDDVPALFWTASGWGNYISLNFGDTDALADLPKVEAMMSFVLEKDQTYYYAGPHLFFGTILGSIPKMFGGDPQKAKGHFEKCLALNEGKFLMTYVFYAKTYAVQMQDRELFETLLRKVEAASPDILPEQRLANMIAKEKAGLLLKNIDEYF
jgi:tetratricopeptide (TPR) repeat protein